VVLSKESLLVPNGTDKKTERRKEDSNLANQKRKPGRRPKRISEEKGEKEIRVALHKERG